MPPYRDNPFEPNTNANLDDYYDSAPPAHRLSGIYSSSSTSLQGRQGALENIPLATQGPTSNAPYQSLDHQPWSAASTDNIATSASAGLPAGAAAGPTVMQAGRYADRREQAIRNSLNADGTEPKFDPWASRPPKSNKKKWIAIGGFLALVGVIVVAVTVGIVVSKNHKNRNTSSSSSSSSSSSGSAVNQTDPNDPSTFVKNSNFHQAFYGMAYTPVGSQLPDCGNTLSAVIQDIQLMSQLTKRIRLYGADCNQSALVLEAIKQTKVDITVYLGNYPVATDNGTAYRRQRDVIKSAIQTYGTDHIGGVTVGNEFMLNYVTENGATDATGAVGNAGAAILIPFIQDTRTMLSGMNLNKNLPVGNSDAGSYFNTQVLQAIDYGMANVHPWFANVSADASAGWTAEFFQEQDVNVANGLSNKPQMYIAETGWPTKSSDAGNANNGASAASIANLQTFLDTFVCQANTNGTGYFFFEFADEDWKDKQFGGVEGWWGLLNQDRTLKSGITIPTCQTP